MHEGAPRAITINFSSQELKKFCWLRITGGEPFLSQSRVKHLVQTLKEINDHLKQNKSDSFRIIIQSNGSLVSQHIINKLKQLEKLSNLKILFELSLKGTNECEFNFLTGMTSSLYNNQIKSYYAFRDMVKDSDNLFFRCRMGIGPHRRTVIFIYPETYPNNNKELSEGMFLPSKWSSNFERVYQQEINSHGYLAMEHIYVTEGGINSRTNLYIPAVVRLLEKKIILDRGNKINYYNDFKRISKIKFPELTTEQIQYLDDQFSEIKNKFPLRPSETYLEKNEFP